MACEKYEELLHRHFDNALSSDEEAHLQEHLKGCRRCRIDMKLYTWMFRAMAGLAEVAPPLDFTRSVMESIGKLPSLGLSRRAGFSVRDLVWGVGVAAVSLALIGGGLFWYGQPTAPARLVRAPLPMMKADGYHLTQETGALRAPELGQERVRLFCDGPNVRILPNGTQRWQRVAFEKSLVFGDRVQTPPDFGARLVYPDQTWIRLKPGTTVQVLAEAIRVYHGDTWIKVEKRGTRFQALTPNAVASVRGTAYTAGVTFRPTTAYGKDLSDRMLSAALPGTDLVAASLTGRLVSALVTAAGSETYRKAIRSEFKVYESAVDVRALAPETLDETAAQIVHEGSGVLVADGGVTEPAPLAVSDYLAWNLPPAPSLLHPQPRPVAVSRPVAGPTAADVIHTEGAGSGPDFEALRKHE